MTEPMTWPPKMPSRAPPITIRSEFFSSAKLISDWAKDSPTRTVEPAFTPRSAECADRPRDPLLAAVDEELLVFGAAGVTVRHFLADDEDDVERNIRFRSLLWGFNLEIVPSESFCDGISDRRTPLDLIHDRQHAG